MGFDASVGEKLGLTRIGIHHVRVPAGRRISYPHAESAEEEFVFVIEGRPDAWIDGELFPLQPGDSVAFPAGTGICHTFLNNTARRGAAARRRRKTEAGEPHPLSVEPGTRSVAVGSLGKPAGAGVRSARRSRANRRRVARS